jgi:hypothetical protein
MPAACEGDIGRRCEMSTVSHQPTNVAPTRRTWSEQLLVRETWASIAIFAMWVAVCVTSVWGPDFVSTTPGGSTTTIPSGIAVALFATIGTWAVAKHGLRQRDHD